MKISEKRLNKVIKESIEDFLRSNSVDSFTPYDAKQAAINKAAIGTVGNKSYDDAIKADTSAKEYGTIRGYNDWSANYRDTLDYPSYRKKFGLRR